MIFITDIESSLTDLDDGIEATQFDSAKRIEKKRKFHEIIQFHADAKQLSSLSL